MQFSCIIPVFNSKPHHLFECLNSIVSQTVKADEIIVVNDGSTSPETITALNAAVSIYGIQLYTLDANMGISHALNFAIDKAKHEWIARMDADDISLPTRFEKQIEYINAHPEADVVGCSLFGFNNGDINKTAIFNLKHPEVISMPPENAEVYFCTNHGTVFYKKSVVSQLKYNTEFRRGQDVRLWCALLNAGYTIRNIPNMLYAYRRYGS